MQLKSCAAMPVVGAVVAELPRRNSDVVKGSFQ